MSWYISGPIKGYEDTYRANFAQAQGYVKSQGVSVVNPVEVGDELEGALDRTPTYEEFMREDLVALLHCEGIYMLKGWEKSAGARCEHLVAVMSGLEVRYL